MARKFFTGVKIIAGDENTLYLDTGATGAQTTIFYQVNGSYKYQQRVGTNYEIYNYTTSNWDYHIQGSTGYFALGHNDPKARLHLSGDASTNSAIRQSRTGVVIWDQAIDSSGRLQWGTRSSEGGTRTVHFTLDDDGRVGIGTVPAASVDLHVNGDVRVDATDGVATRKIRSSYFSSTTDIRVESGSAGDVILGDSAAARLTLASDDTATFVGNVTIGALTSGETAQLTVNNEGGVPSIARFKSRTNKAHIEISDNDTTGYISSENGLFSIGRNAGVNAAHININASNQVLIGASTTSFNDKLYLSGDAYINGSLRVGTAATYVGKMFNSSGVLTIQSDGDRDIQIGSSNNVDVIAIDTSAQSTTFSGNVTVSGGTLNLGNDVSLFDDGTNILRTDDALHANANLHVGGGGIIYNRADTNNYIKFNSPNVQIKGHLLPDSDGSYKLGLGSGTNLRWNGIELTSGADINWSNGDAKISEGDDDNYSLNFFTYDGTDLSKALQLKGDNSASFDSGKLIIDNVSANGRIHGTSSIFLGGVSTTLVQLSAKLIPDADSSRDLGTTTRYWKDAYIDTITTTGNTTIGGDILLDQNHIHIDGNGAVIFDNTNNNNAWYIRNGGTNSATLQFGLGGTPGSNITHAFNGSGNVEFGGVLSLPDGSVSSPSINNTGDANTGMYFPGDHQVGFAVNGSRKLYISTTEAFFQNLSSGVSINAGGIDVTGDSTFAGDITLGANHIGRDGDNYVGFETDNVIKFRANGATQVKVYDGVFAPQTDSDVDLGTSSLYFKAAYIDAITTTGDITVGGDLTVNGTTTTVNSTNLDLSDNIIGLNRGATSNANDSGLIIERGSTGDNAAFVWDESIGYFSFGTTQKTASATGAVANESDWTWKPIKASSAIFTDTITIPEYINHTGDGNTNFGFGGSDDFRVTVGGTKRLNVTTGGVEIEGTVSISGDGSNATTLTESGSGDFTIDVAGDITLDAAGNDIRLFKAGVEYGKFKSDSSNLALYSSVENKDMIFRGNDGGTTIDALTLDMSENGTATFSDSLAITGSTLQTYQQFQSDPVSSSDGNNLFSIGGQGMAAGYSRNISIWSTTQGVWRSWVGTNLRFDGTNYKRASNAANNNWGNVAGIEFKGGSGGSDKTISFYVDEPENSSGGDTDGTVGTSIPSAWTALEIDNNRRVYGYGNFYVGSYSYFGAAYYAQSNTAYYVDPDGTSNVNKFRFGTSSDLQTGSSKLDVAGISAMRNSSDSAATLYIQNHSSTTSTIQPYIYLADSGGNRGGLGVETSTAIMSVNGQGGLKFQTGASGVAGTEALLIDNSQNIKFNGAYIFPKTIGSAGQVLKVPSSGTSLEWGTVSGGGDIDGSGAANRLAIWSDSDTLTSNVNITVSSGQLNLGNGLLVEDNDTTVITAKAYEPHIVWQKTRGSSGDDYFKIKTENDAMVVDFTTARDGGSDTRVLRIDNNNNFVFSTNGSYTQLHSSFMSVYGRLTSSSDIRSTQYYDYNDTTKYIDLNTTGLSINANGIIRTNKPSSHTSQSSITANDAHLDLYNSLESNTDQKGSIITFTDNYYDGSNYHKTTRAAIKGGTDTVGNTADGYLEFYTDSAGANSPNLALRLDKDRKATFTVGTTAIGLEVNGSNSSYTAASILNTGSGDAILWMDASNGDLSGADYASIRQTNGLSLLLKTESSGGAIIFQPAADTALTLATDKSATFAGSVHLDNDSAQLQLGDDNDMQVYHNGAHGYVKTGTGDLVLQSNGDDVKILAQDDVVIRDNDDATEMAKFINGGAVELYHNGSKKIETTSTGIEVTGNIQHTGLTMTSGTDVDQVKEFTMSFQLAANTWTDTGIDGSDLATGTYAMQVYVDDHSVGGSHYDEYYSGMMSWFAGQTNETAHATDEIPVHRAGHAPNDGNVQFRTTRGSSADLKLQVKHNEAYSAALDNSNNKKMTFKFRRLI